MSEHLHLVQTDEGGDVWSLSSPQLPGFVYGDSDPERFESEMAAALSFAGAPDLPRVRHIQRRIVTPEGQEVLIRLAQDEHREERMLTAAGISELLKSDERHSMVEGPKIATGEVQYICATPTDTLRWLLEQLDDRGDVVVVAIREGTRGLWTLNIAHDVELDSPTTLDDLGLTDRDTVVALHEAVNTAGSEARRPVLV